jgi:hypothetical protein
MKLLPILLLTGVAALSACSSSTKEVQVQVTTSTHNGTWTGTIAGTSLLTWRLDETPNGAGFLVEGTGMIQSIDCETAVRIAGDRTGNDSFLLVTIDSLPDFEMSVSGSFIGERYQGIYSIDSGVSPPDCIPEVGGVLRVGERNDAGLNGRYYGSWAITPSFADTVGPYGTMQLVQTGTDVFGTVDWHGNYPCASRGFLSGTFDGEVFLANVFSQNPNDAYHLLEATLDEETAIFNGLSTLLSAGPSPSCPLLGETLFYMLSLPTVELSQADRPAPEPVGLLHRFDAEGRKLDTGVILRVSERAD